jgi:hypothetical protein
MTRERDVMSHNMHPGRKSRAGESKSMPDDQPFCITLLGESRLEISPHFRKML